MQKNAIFSKTKQFRTTVSIDDLDEVAHGLFKEPIIGPPKIQDGGDQPSWILTPKCKNAIFWKTEQFRATVYIDHL